MNRLKISNKSSNIQQRVHLMKDIEILVQVFAVSPELNAGTPELMLRKKQQG